MENKSLKAYLQSKCSAGCAMRPQVLKYFVAPEPIYDLESERIIAQTGQYVVVGDNHFTVVDREDFDLVYDIIYLREPEYATHEIPQTC